MIFRFMVLSGLFLLTACSTPKLTAETPLELGAAHVEREAPRPIEIVEIPKPIPFPNQLKPLPHLSAPLPPVSPKESVKEANVAARVEPIASGFINAIQVWPYSPAALYQVYA